MRLSVTFVLVTLAACAAPPAYYQVTPHAEGNRQASALLNANWQLSRLPTDGRCGAYEPVWADGEDIYTPACGMDEEELRRFLYAIESVPWEIAKISERRFLDATAAERQRRAELCCTQSICGHDGN